MLATPWGAEVRIMRNRIAERVIRQPPGHRLREAA
jgi:hypothetical protein